MDGPVVILGLGFTTRRLARKLRERDVSVFATVRNASRFGELERLGVKLCALTPDELPKGAVLIHTVPPLPDPGKTNIRSLICDIAPRRILYISSTGVYGRQSRVSEDTVPAPNDEKGFARIEEEEWITQSDAAQWSTLILRSAAIYGLGRGIHVRLRQGRWQEAMTPQGRTGIISRIHVDDLVTLLDAGIDSSLEGAWPVADEHPATSMEVAKWCTDWMGLTLPTPSEVPAGAEGRRVDGKKIRQLLGVELKYPSFQTGVPASLREERDSDN